MVMPRILMLISPVLCFAAAIVVAISYGSLGPAAEANALNAAIASIEVEQLRDHVGTLAADSFEGREAGTRGGQAAATYLMKNLESYGLAGAGESGGYFQPFRSYRNVLAVLPGSDEKLKDEYVIVSAHFDHVGYGAQSSNGASGYIHNGADDNASGTSALLEVAEAFSKLPVAPRRSILFAFWDAEEKGLLGSEHWASTPTVPLDRVKCNINADMVGRMVDEKVIVYGTRSSAGLRRMLAEWNETTNLRLSYVWWINPQSDHYTFFRRKIPVVMFHTGLHKDYHRPADDAEKIDVEGMQRIARLMFQTTYAFAQRDEALAFRNPATWETTTHRKQFERPPLAAPPRLGVTWQPPHEGDAPGLVLNTVLADSIAEHAGLKPSDRVTKFAGEVIADGEHLRRLVAQSSGATSVEVVRTGSDKPLLLEMVFPGGPPRLGISWRENDGEPGTVAVVNVVAGSAAEKAGVQRLDRIYKIADQGFTSSDEFQQLAAAASGPTSILVEREGRLLKLTVPLDERPAATAPASP
jgi:hypothetical protein